MTVVADTMFDEFFSQPIPHEGFVLQPKTETDFFGLIDATMFDRPELRSYAITLDGSVVVPELRPRVELKN
jgi:hypothetical protein